MARVIVDSVPKPKLAMIRYEPRRDKCWTFIGVKHQIMLRVPSAFDRTKRLATSFCFTVPNNCTVEDFEVAVRPPIDSAVQFAEFLLATRSSFGLD